MTKFFLDAEFIESGADNPIDLISIGIVSSDGREYYAVNEECQFENASAWVWENVLYPIGIYSPVKYINLSDPSISPNTKNTISQLKSRQQIKEEIVEFVGVDKREALRAESSVRKTSPEFWGEWCSYDWVVFAQLFGTMMDLPSGFPMRCSDIIQWAEDHLGIPSDQLPPSLETPGNHNALLGAKTVQERYYWLESRSKN